MTYDVKNEKKGGMIERKKKLQCNVIFTGWSLLRALTDPNAPA